MIASALFESGIAEVLPIARCSGAKSVLHADAAELERGPE
jgi:hypothetical protein